MAIPFLSSEEYDERAHNLYNDGEYEGALELLKEGLRYYPHSVELYVGLGYTRLAREEYVWARHAFEKALVLDGEHEEALVGLGETVLRFGERTEALALFERARETGCTDDLDLILSMARALYREQLFPQARDAFLEATKAHASSAEAAAGLGYTLHRLGETASARRELRRALHLDAEYHEARVFLGHMLYDAGNWRGALDELERVAPNDHWDPVSVWRVLELKRALAGLEPGSPELQPWEVRLEELESDVDPLEELLTEVEAIGPSVVSGEPSGRPAENSPRRSGPHRAMVPDGRVFAGSWYDIVRQLRDALGRPHENIAQFMQRWAAEARARSGARIDCEDPEGFLRDIARAGLLDLDARVDD